MDEQIVIMSAAGKPLISVKGNRLNIEIKAGGAWLLIAPSDARDLAAALIAPTP